MLSKKHYKAIGDILARHNATEDALLQDLCDYFKSDNDLFRRGVFIEYVLSKVKKV